MKIRSSNRSNVRMLCVRMLHWGLAFGMNLKAHGTVTPFVTVNSNLGRIAIFSHFLLFLILVIDSIRRIDRPSVVQSRVA